MFKQNLSKAFHKFLLNPDPPMWWIFLRFFLNWLTIPLKLLLIGGLGIYQIIKHKFVSKNRPPEPKSDVINLDYLLSNLPLIQNGHLTSYANRVPTDESVTGLNHNTDHQCSRHGTYAFLLSRLGTPRDETVEKGLYSHIQGKYLCRGYTTDGTYNARTTSGDMLCGLNLAMLDTKNDILKERYEVLIENILANDYSLLEAQVPGNEANPDEDEIIPIQIYKERLAEAQNRPENVRMKSARGMWQPSVEHVGAQALTLLASLRVAEVKCQNPRAKSAYWKLLWLHGQGLLSLFPTAYIDTRRGYFNDHNCIISLYVLSKLSTSKLGKLFWKIPMYYVWSLSKHWYNGYFTGLMFDAYPEMLKSTSNRDYLWKCLAYLREVDSLDQVLKRPMDYDGEQLTYEVPVSVVAQREDEFSPDMGHNIISNPMENTRYYRTGLGYLADITMVLVCFKNSNQMREVNEDQIKS
jgi:hypothetical protein